MITNLLKLVYLVYVYPTWNSASKSSSLIIAISVMERHTSIFAKMLMSEVIRMIDIDLAKCAVAVAIG